MKKTKRLTIATLVLVIGLAVPAQAAIKIGTPYSPAGAISLRSLTSTTAKVAPDATQTTSSLKTPVLNSTNKSGSSVISLKDYFSNITTKTPTTPGTTAPIPTGPQTPSPTPSTPAPAPTSPAPKPTTPTTPAPAPVTPTPTPPSTQPSTAPATSLNAQEQQMVDEINKERAASGLAPLKVDLRLAGLARTKAQDMKTNGYFSHTSPTYGTPFDMLKNAGIQYRSAGENIARNVSVDAAMAAFMSSDGHRKNILNSGYTHVGIGVVSSSSGNYYVQIFAQL